MADTQAPGTRSQALFEDYPGCPTPPPFPLQWLDDPDALRSLGVRNAASARLLLRAAFLASGYTRFHDRELPARFDEVVQRRRERVPGTGPIVAATLALADGPEPIEPLERAARMLRALWDMHREVRGGRFAPDEHKGHLHEMRQYLNLFGTGVLLDHGEFRIAKTPVVSRILVLARGLPFVVDFGGDDAGVPGIRRALESVWRAAGGAGDGTRGALGLLSSASLPLQKEVLPGMLAEQAGAAAYDALRHTFTTVCLDLEHEPSSYPDAARLAQTGNLANRWFHASVQLVVFGNARACVICDFNPALGGNTMVRASAEIQRRASAAPDSNPPGAAPPRIEAVEWPLDAAARERLQADVASILDTQRATFEIAGFGRAAFSARGLDPVPAFGVALQLAVLKLTGRFPWIRQFVSISRYRCQTVTLSSVSTPEMADAVQALLKAEAPAAELARLVRAAIESQKREINKARSRMSVAGSLALYRAVQTGRKRRVVEAVLTRTFALLGKMKLREATPPTDIVISHPAIYPEVPVIGRPGVKLPYLTCFGLHYQLWDDRLVLSLMPSPAWAVPNETLIAELRTCLATVLAAGT